MEEYRAFGCEDCADEHQTEFDIQLVEWYPEEETVATRSAINVNDSGLSFADIANMIEYTYL